MNDSFFYTPQGETLALVLTFWSAFWKGIALWRAAKLDQRYWFIGLFIVNTIGILEIIYLFNFAHKKLSLEELRTFFMSKNLHKFKPHSQGLKNIFRKKK